MSYYFGLNIEKEYKYYKKNFKKYFPKDRKIKILDYGCGAGAGLYYCIKEGYMNITGIDINETAVELSSKLAGKFRVFLVSEEFTTNDKYDLILLIDVLEHIKKEKISSFLSNINSMLNQNGMLIIRTINANCPIASQTRYNGFDHELSFTVDSFKYYLEQSGFTSMIKGESHYNPIINCIRMFFNLLTKIYYAVYGSDFKRPVSKQLIAICKNDKLY